MTDLPQVLIGELGRTKEMFLAWFNLASKLSGFTFIEKNRFPIHNVTLENLI